MRYHVLFVANDRLEPRYFARFDSAADDQARGAGRREVAGRGFLIREDGMRLVRVADDGGAQ
jgi:hypothetical protein